MSELAFFPWFTIKTEVQVGPFRLLRYQRGKQPGGEDQATLDVVIRPYHSASGRSLEQCTLLSLSENSLTADLSREQRDAVFRFAELAAFSGLGTRHFFSHLDYSNRDNFRLVVQGFRELGAGILVVTRRRDGSTKTYHSGDTYRVRCPSHVTPTALELDNDFLLALLAAETRGDWSRLLQAIVLFNEANTDRDFVPEAAELVLSFAALEQLLNIQADPKALGERFQATWVPKETIPRVNWKVRSERSGVNNRLAQAPNLRSAWIEDMGVTRGSMAHGHGTDAYPSIWSPSEHLLFVAFALPRLMKLHLSGCGLYTLTDDDHRDIDALEPLLNERHFARGRAEDDPPWPRIIGDAAISRLARKIAKEFLPDE